MLPPVEVARMLERVVVRGDLSVMSDQDKVRYYRQVCSVVGIPLELRPFEFIKLNGREVLYVLRSCTEYLRDQRGIACTIESRKELPGELFEVVVKVIDRTGRTDFGSGIVSLRGLSGEARANAMMKAETKAKRRATLSISGLGLLDESEVSEHPCRSMVATPGAAAPDDSPSVPDAPAFAAWRDAGDEPEGVKRVVGVVTTARESSDAKGPIVKATVSIEGDGGTIEVATRDTGAYGPLSAAVAGRMLVEVRFVEVGSARKLVSVELAGGGA